MQENSKHVSLYRKYRPQKFGEIAGQSAAVDMLVSALQNGKTGHAYLFSGPRGCGKTTAARLLAKSLNCINRAEKSFEPCEDCENCKAITQGESLDVVEIDGASNNSVDEARELKSQANLAPFNSRYKIYIIDEVHMLSIAAFNALLK
ncbi:MAG: AAA family ATPase, partial [Synergistaceae bacterium]|nr:AAA family ATPase [Synergistaceae bacterium]